jgi:hypothetical protein
VVLGLIAFVVLTNWSSNGERWFDWRRQQMQMFLTVSGTTFTLGSTLGAKDYLVEFHKAGLASADTAANTDGTMNTTLTSVNTISSFAISLYEGTGTAGTVSTGLSAQDIDFVIIKNRDQSARNWIAGHSSVGFTKYLRLNAGTAATTSSTRFNDTAPSAPYVTVGTENVVNESSQSMVMFAWHAVEGYSFFGAYEGNGNADGPFINSGMADGAVIVKTIDAANGWALMDKAAGLYNPHINFLQFNTTAIGSGDPEDLVSNGLKVRNVGGTTNAASTLIYCQIGGTSIKYARGR